MRTSPEHRMGRSDFVNVHDVSICANVYLVPFFVFLVGFLIFDYVFGVASVVFDAIFKR